MTIEVSLDLETLDTPGSKKKLPTILSIGGCVFDSSQVNDYEFFTGDSEVFAQKLSDGVCFATDKLYYSPVSLLSSLSKGFTVSADTAKYWNHQSYNMVEQAAKFRDKVGDTLKDFGMWLKYIKAERVWANAPTFDISILREAFEHVGLDIEIEFRNERCVRTGIALMDVKWPTFPAHFMKHHACCDAIVEATMVQVMYEKKRHYAALQEENPKLITRITELEAKLSALGLDPGSMQGKGLLLTGAPL